MKVVYILVLLVIYSCGRKDSDSDIFSKIYKDNIVLQDTRSTLGKAVDNRILLNPELEVMDSFIYKGYGSRLISDQQRYYLLDYSNKQCLQLNQDLVVIGKRGFSGGGPKEHGTLKYIKVFDTHYFTFDFSFQRIRKYSLSDDLLETKDFREQTFWASDVIHLKDELFLIAGSSGDESFEFKTYDFATGVTETKRGFVDSINTIFGLFPNNGADLIFEGYFSKSHDSPTIYTYNKVGLVTIFTKNGDFDRFVQTLDKSTLPEMRYQDAGDGVMLHVLFPDFYINYARSVDSSYFYILSNIMRPSYKSRRVVDVYRMSDGSYFKSFIVPNTWDGQLPTQLSVDGTHVLFLYENGTLIKYKMPLLN